MHTGLAVRLRALVRSGLPGIALTMLLAAPGGARAQAPEAVCVDGGSSGRPFAGVTCVRTVTTLADGLQGAGPGSLVVVRAFWSRDANSIAGMGTYRDDGLLHTVIAGTTAQPIILQAEGFNTRGTFEKPIIDGGVRVTGTWTLVPGTQATWQTPWDVEPGSFRHEACVDRIWVSRVPGRTQLANFPLTRPMPNQGNDHSGDCADNTVDGQPMTPQLVDRFPGSYEWMDGNLYVHLPGGEDPNRYTLEVPFRHPLSAPDGTAGLVVRGFRVYHSVNGIDLWHCGHGPDDKCDATFNETSFNTHFGLQPGPYSLLSNNRGILNTIQLIKITSDFSEIAYNVVGPQLSQGFKLNVVHDCLVHHNQVYGNNLGDGGTQAGWTMLGTRDTTAGILVKNGTQRCQIYNNYVHHNRVGIYLRNDGDTLTQGNIIHDNSLPYNQQAIVWRDAGLWQYNVTANNSLGWGAKLRWGDTIGSAAEFLAATGINPGR